MTLGSPWKAERIAVGCAMDAVLGLLLLVGVLLLIVRSARGQSPGDFFAGLFKNQSDLGWPRGVQEDDVVLPWGAPAHDRDPDDERAVIEDLPTPGGLATPAAAPLERPRRTHQLLVASTVGRRGRPRASAAGPPPHPRAHGGR